MLLNRIAPPLASVFLSLSLVAAVLPSTQHGFVIDLAKVVDCGRWDDRRTVVLILHAGRAVQINQEPIDWELLPPRLWDIFATRNERIVFVSVDSDVSYPELIALIDSIASAAIDRISLVTSQAEQQVDGTRCVTLGCPYCKPR